MLRFLFPHYITIILRIDKNPERKHTGRRSMSFISLDDTIFTITEKYPETVDIFVSRGFPGMSDYNQRAGYGRLLSLRNALKTKGLNEELFTGLLNEAVENQRGAADITLAKIKHTSSSKAVKIAGLLPCPVRIPLMEEFSRFSPEYEKASGLSLSAELKAASSGTEWVKEHLDGETSEETLPDIFISAGFDLFFDRKRIGRLREQGAFKDLLKWDKENSSFEGLDIRDPDGVYSILALVPAVFLVNTGELGNRPIPKTWKELLTEDFYDSVSLPVGDFDLFNAMLLSLRQKYGDDAIRMLGRVMQQAMHPSQMVKSDKKQGKRPAVTIMPYFFTKTVRDGGAMQAVWPEDGAVISPIFMLAKAARQEELQPAADFFGSSNIGEILARQGLFPSLHPDVDNILPEKSPVMWLGWDYIKNHDLSEEITKAEALFNSFTKVSEKEESVR